MSAGREQRVVHVDDGDRRSPIQILTLVAGIVFAVLGGVALLRTGLGSLFEPTTSVAGLDYTPLLAVVELAFGVLLLSAGAFPRAYDAIVFLGVLALVFGLIIVIEPDAFQGSLAAGRAHGWLYVVTGGVLAGAALALPGVRARRASGTTRYVERERSVTDEAGGRERAGRAGTPARDARADDTRPLDTDDTRS